MQARVINERARQYFYIISKHKPSSGHGFFKVKMILHSCHCSVLSNEKICRQALIISTANAALQTDLDGLTCRNFLPLLEACSKIHGFHCDFLRLDFQLVAAFCG